MPLPALAASAASALAPSAMSTAGSILAPIALGADFGDMLGSLLGFESPELKFAKQKSKGDKYRTDLLLQMLGLGSPTASKKQQKGYGFLGNTPGAVSRPAGSLSSLSLLGGPTETQGTTDEMFNTIMEADAGERARLEQDSLTAQNKVTGSASQYGLGGISTKIRQGLQGVQREKGLLSGQLTGQMLGQRLGVLESGANRRLAQQGTSAQLLASLLGLGLA